MSYFAGIDIGASTTKAILLDEQKEILGHAVCNSGTDLEAAAERAFQESRETAGLKTADKCIVIATGYGRRNVPFAEGTKTEISCHAKGSFHYFPRAHTIIDVGGQDSKVIKIDDSGKRTSFKMNRKCAAGTGAFLEEMANRLKIQLKDLSELAEKAEKDIHIGSYCTVFAASEILTKIREGAGVADIVKAVFDSMVKRVLEMVPIDGDIVLSGGVVAHFPVFIRIFEGKVGRKALVPPLPQLTGAVGAALYALQAKGDKHA